jgi:threonine dehydrogenase-like Zn-dependent dehydrogenase
VRWARAIGADRDRDRAPRRRGRPRRRPQEETIPASRPAFYNNISVGGGPAPVRAYVEELLPDVLEGRIEPGRVFDRAIGLDEVPEGYRAMNDREAIKVMVKP